MQMTVPERARQNVAAFHRSMKRRCLVHDYKGRSIYLVTLEVAGRRQLLGRIAAASRPAHLTDGEWPEIPLSVAGLSEVELSAINEPLFEPSELGRRVAEEFMKIGEHVAGVKPLLAQAMPDHFHGILFVTREINRTLGSIMAGFKGKCSQVARELGVTQALTRRAPDRAEKAGAERRLSRDECLTLNALAAEICGGNAADIVYQSRLGVNPG